jgi:phosphoribosylformylglycinamidine synthase
VLFTAAAILRDVNKVVSMDVKQPGDLVYVVGETKNELGGGEYLALRGQLGTHVPTVDPKRARALYTALSKAIGGGLVASCHDCSDGGLGVALAESAFAGGFGMQIDLKPMALESNVVALFSESQSRFMVTVPTKHVAAFESNLKGLPHTRIGVVIPETLFRLKGQDGFDDEVSLAELKEAWQRPLRW